MNINYLLILNRIKRGYAATHDEAVKIFRQLMAKLHIYREIDNFLEEGKTIKKGEEE